MLLETILCKFGQICATGNALMLLETILCKFGQICATGNALKQLETISCKFGRICATRKAPNAAGNDFMQVRTNLCDRKCSYATGNDFMRVWTNLCDRESFSVTNCWQKLHFEFSCRNVTGMCRAHLCGDRCDDSSHSKGQFGKRLLLAFRGHPIWSPAQG